MSNFSITSPSFNEGEEIPKKFGYKFENKNPEIDFENVPKDAKSLALIMDDPDAMGAVGKVWVHWLVCNWNPTKLDIDEGFRREMYKILMTKKDFSLAEGKTDFGENGYGGPAPPDKRHTYIFKAYALDTTSGFGRRLFQTRIRRCNERSYYCGSKTYRHIRTLKI